MKNLAVLIFLFCCFVQGLTAQNSNTCSCTNIITGESEPNLPGDLFYEKNVSTPNIYFYPDFLEGDIFLKNGECSKDKYIRYNSLKDEIIMLQKDSMQQIMLDKYYIDAFTLNNYHGSDTLFFKKIKVKLDMEPDSSFVFGQLLFKGNLSLYVYRRSIPAGMEISTTGSGIYGKDLFVFSPIYYFILPDKTTIGFKSFRKRHIKKLFPGKEDEIKKLLKDNHQRHFRSEYDLIRIAGILNKLF